MCVCVCVRAYSEGHIYMHTYEQVCDTQIKEPQGHKYGNLKVKQKTSERQVEPNDFKVVESWGVTASLREPRRPAGSNHWTRSFLPEQ